MTTTIDIPDHVLQKAMLAAHTNSPQEAVVKALEEYGQRHRQADLVQLLGTFDDFMTPQELSQMREMD